jgi:hypothetical protein
MNKRPSLDTALITRALAEHMLPRVLEWCYAGDETEADKEGTLRDLTKAFDVSDMDGYKIAAKLDWMGWDPDAELVEILNLACFRRHELRSQLDKKWAAENQPPIFSENQTVMDINRGTVGVIKKVIAEELCYLIEYTNGSGNLVTERFRQETLTDDLEALKKKKKARPVEGSAY